MFVDCLMSRDFVILCVQSNFVYILDVLQTVHYETLYLIYILSVGYNYNVSIQSDCSAISVSSIFIVH
jgi:hypothetical protein